MGRRNGVGGEREKSSKTEKVYNEGFVSQLSSVSSAHHLLTSFKILKQKDGPHPRSGVSLITLSFSSADPRNK
jgi:hypothetical protein